MPVLKFLGVGSAFTLPEDGDLNNCDWQSNMMITADSGKRMLIDCGSDIRFSLAQQDIYPMDYGQIDAVYISHLHADHMGGLECIGFCTYFNPTVDRPKLYCNNNVMYSLWNHGLRGGMESIQTKMVTLTEYFDCEPVYENGSFVWEGILFTPVQTVHVVAGYTIKHSYGLLIQNRNGDNGFVGDAETERYGKVTFITTDTQFAPNQLIDYYKMADVIFQDCETTPYKSGVHSHISDLEGLGDEIKTKMWLYHYSSKPVTETFNVVEKNQEFEI